MNIFDKNPTEKFNKIRRLEQEAEEAEEEDIMDIIFSKISGIKNELE